MPTKPPRPTTPPTGSDPEPDLNSILRPELKLFILACEFRMRLHDKYYNNSWPRETRRSVFNGLDRNTRDLQRAIVDQDWREQANEACDLANWAWFLPMQNEFATREFKEMARAITDPDFTYPEHKRTDS